MTDSVLTWDEFLEVPKEFVTFMETQHQNPDDDWGHYLFIEAKGKKAQALLSGQPFVDEIVTGELTDESVGLVVLPMPLPPDTSGAFDALGMVIELVGAVRVAIVTSVWALEASPLDVRPPEVSKVPGSYEAVHILAFDDSEHRVLETRIHRSDGMPPMLSEWKEYGNVETELTAALQKRLK